VGGHREGVDARLKDIMRAIHKQCRDTAEEYDTPGNYVNGANIAGFVKVADAMLDQGLVCPRFWGAPRLRGGVAVDVLVDPSLVGTRVTAPPSGVRIERPALVD